MYFEVLYQYQETHPLAAFAAIILINRHIPDSRISQRALSAFRSPFLVEVIVSPGRAGCLII
jgi:hypothetical protein